MTQAEFDQLPLLLRTRTLLALGLTRHKLANLRRQGILTPWRSHAGGASYWRKIDLAKLCGFEFRDGCILRELPWLLRRKAWRAVTGMSDEDLDKAVASRRILPIGPADGYGLYLLSDLHHVCGLPRM